MKRVAPVTHFAVGYASANVHTALCILQAAGPNEPGATAALEFIREAQAALNGQRNDKQALPEVAA